MTPNEFRQKFNVFLLVLAICLAGCEESPVIAKTTASICYIPVSSSTYAPVSREKLSFKCTDLGVFAVTDPLISGFLEVVARSERVDHFDDNVVRLSLRLSDATTIYVNKLGEVQRNGITVKVPAEHLEKLDRGLYEVQQKVFRN